jgi:peroxiredoxin
MKRTLVVIAAIMMMFGCQQNEQPKGFVVNGTATDVYNGIRLYLNNIGPRGRLTPIDTAIVMNETFKFEGKLSHPKLLYLTMNSVPGRFPLMVENGEMTMTIDKTNLQNTIFEGSESHQSYLTFVDKYKAFQSGMMTQSRAFTDARSINDSTAMEKATENLTKIREEAQEYPYQFMESRPKDFVSLEIYEMQLNQREKDEQRLIDIFDNFDESLKSSGKGLQLKTKTAQMKKEMEANKNLQIGMKAPDFSGTDPDGNTISLSEVVNKGKVTIIDFWAAWCGPCRRENPNVVRIYNKYHDQGLEIIGVSLDGQSRQQDPKKAWLDAIEEDNLTWNHVSNLKYFNDPIAKTYNIQAIPATYILDSEGKIVDKNLRGSRLELKVMELLGIE